MRYGIWNESGERRCSECGLYQSREMHPEGRDSRCKTCNKARAEAYRKANPEKVKERAWRASIKRRYGIDHVEYAEMLEAQDGVCAICGRDPSDCKDGRLVVDHDHETLEVRGLLCNNCNRGIGFLGDAYLIVAAAAEYLKD